MVRGRRVLLRIDAPNGAGGSVVVELPGLRPVGGQVLNYRGELAPEPPTGARAAPAWQRKTGPIVESECNRTTHFVSSTHL